ncbi:hypothetical protein [Caulobacter sp. 17J65-9]|uniref:hypothetical protein n=1 Tax=Caulobacter sp. 17J65-9 TaxID=2709382 RepID=UPI0013CAE5F4|nr:hypothetical protein [Caulobacter sp. 17J65-9]NEX92060.1 hypothetical protein [Caulobacter sp. 17J65-9]
MARIEAGAGGGGVEAVQERPAEAAVWPLWRELKKGFSTWSLAGSAFVTPGSWGYAGLDFVTGLRRNRSTHEVFALLEGVSEAQFEALSALAALNARRQEQMFRVVALGYITIPLTLIATWAEIAPEGVVALLGQNTQLALYAVFLFTFGVLAYFASSWRSRQIVSVLELVRIERRLAPAAPKRRGG